MKKTFLFVMAFCLSNIGIFASGPSDSSTVVKKGKIAGEIAWKYQSNSAITSSPVFSDGIIYTGCGSSLVALDTSGKEVFRFKTQGSIKCRAAVDNNNIYFQSGDGCLYCLDKKSGKEVWKTKLDSNNLLQLYDYWDYYQSSPLISENTLYVGSSDSYLYAIDSKTGKEIWKFKTLHIIRSSPVVKDGLVYFGSFDGNFYAVNDKSGELVWKYKIEKPNYSRMGEIQSSALVYDGKVIFGSRDGILHTLDANTGKEIRNYSHEGSWVISTPVLSGSLIVSASSDAHFVDALDIKTGKESWRYNTKFNVFSSPIVYDGVVYCGEGNAYSFSEEASFFALDVETGKEIWKIKTGGQVWSTPIAAEGRIYFGAMDGFIYSIK
jgi:outer membrane protein assembly factor BamB